MTIEEKIAEKLLPIVQAWLEGKQIQYLDNEDNWKDLRKDFCPIGYKDVRIKPQPKYRPFKSLEEALGEMQKHNNCGWLKLKTHNRVDHVCSISEDSDDGIVYFVIISYNSKERISSEQMFKYYTFTDGMPFGITQE